MPIDYTKYHPDWRDIIRPQILKRAGYKCENCGIRQRAKGYRDSSGVFIDCDEFMINWAKSMGIKTFTVYLAIAHLNHDITDNDPNNLKALCQKCHNNHDKNYRHLNRISK